MITEVGLSHSMQEHIKHYLQKISLDIENMLNTIDNNDCCILNDFEQIHHTFVDLQTTAASYYLNSYLSPFTDRYQALSTAIQHFSERKHGALILIERKDPIEPLIHSGTPIGANLSYTLLESIFYPGSPLHDGAVLIRHNMIVSAGNILPLSHKALGKKKLGTRHRAAVGISEISDALVLVVSEETGRASFALDGKLYPIHPGGMIV